MRASGAGSAVWLPLARLVRRYVAWSERQLKSELVEMRLGGLEHWQAPAPGPQQAEILPLSRCGTEALLRSVYNEAGRDCPGFRRARWIDIIAFTADSSHDRNGIFVARCNGRYVGAAVGRSRSSGRGMIYNVAVRPEFRRRGIARSLLHSALTYLRDQGAREACLYVHPENTAAIRLYYREGFEAMAPLPAAGESVGAGSGGTLAGQPR